MQKYWIRKCKLEFYNKQGDLLYEYYGGSGKRSNKYFESRVVFDIVKTNSSELQTSIIKMYNLNKEGNLYNALIQERLKVKVYAGYGDNFEKEVSNMLPIYSGRIYAKPKTIYNGATSETTLYCYFGVLIKKIKVPSFSIKGNVTTKLLFSSLRDKIDKADIGLKIPNDNDLLKELGSDIFNKQISQLGYSVPVSKTLDEFLTLIAKLLTDDQNEIQWYLDDAKNQIVFCNASEKGKTTNEITLEQGINILEFDKESILQTERSNYLANLTGAKVKIKKHKNKKEIQPYRISTLLQKNIYLDTRITLKNLEAPEKMAISKMRFYGDTHGVSNDWRIDLELYERGNK